MAGITSIMRDFGENPCIVRLGSSDTLATVAGANYILNQKANIELVNSGTFEWLTNDMVAVAASDGDQLFLINAAFTTLTAFPVGNGAVTLPVVSGDFAVFNGTLGGLKDSGFLPSDPAQTNVVMESGASVVGDIPSYADTSGTITDSGGYKPSDATKTNIVMESGASVIGNLPKYADITGTILDSGIAANKVLVSSFATPDIQANLVWDDITVGHTPLAAGGSVTLQASSGAKQYKLRMVYLNSGGTNFSGGGGNRDLEITDGTTVYAVIPAATIQALVNATWGSTDVPFPAAAAINVSTVAGAPLVAKYANGTTDYTAGSLVLTIEVQRVA